jgi:L-alanine-DL-glutamate epimerase-like enolase superfamily enzyme
MLPGDTDALQIVQPDMFYFRGMVRSMKVAHIAHSFGKQCTPHISGSGLGIEIDPEYIAKHQVVKG